MEIAYSVHGVPIRLTHERWYHIIENHDELAGHFFEILETVENPQCVLRGHGGTLKAIGNLGRGNWLVVVYRELSKADGFVITAYLLDKRPKGEVLWKRS